MRPLLKSISSFGLLVMLLLCTACERSSTPTVSPEKTGEAAKPKVSLGYYTGSADSLAAVISFSTSINIVSVDVYNVSSDGEIFGSDPNTVVKFDQANGIKTLACVSNYNSDPAVEGFDPKLAQAAVVTYREKMISALVNLALQNGYDGINIDFENINYSENIQADRDNFTAFIHELAEKLHQNGLMLIISTPAKTSEDPADSWGYPFDLAALGQDADYLQLMTYDEHGPWSDPGAVSGVDWVDSVLKYSTGLVSPAKLLIGLPAYGYDWSSDSSSSDISWTDFPSLLTKEGVSTHWEDSTQSPWLTYTEKDLTHTVWYENVESIQAKSALVEKYQLGGWSMWALGKEDQSFWDAINK